MSATETEDSSVMSSLSRRNLSVLFVSLLLDLVAFTVILPLLPSVLDYYGSHDDEVRDDVASWSCWFPSKYFTVHLTANRLLQQLIIVVVVVIPLLSQWSRPLLIFSSNEESSLSQISKKTVSQVRPETFNFSLKTIKWWRQYRVIWKAVPAVNNTKLQYICCFLLSVLFCSVFSDVKLNCYWY